MIYDENMGEFYIIPHQGDFLVMENQDHCDAEGNYGMRSVVVYVAHSEQEARDAIEDIGGWMNRH